MYEQQGGGTYQIFKYYTIFELLLLGVDNNNLETSQNYLKILKTHHEEFKDHFHKNRHEILVNLAEALVYKLEPNLQYQAKAQQLLLDLANQAISNIDLLTYFILINIHLCDIYFDEYKLYQHPEALNKAQRLIDRIYSLAASRKIIMLSVHALILRGKLAILQQRFDDMNIFYSKALDLAKETGLDTIYQRIDTEYQLIMVQQKIWQNTGQPSGATLHEQYEQINLSTTLLQMQNAANISDYLAQIPPDILQEIKNTKVGRNLDTGEES